MPTVAAARLFVDPISGIAMLGLPHGQTFSPKQVCRIRDRR
jgi:hypothetical protein